MPLLPGAVPAPSTLHHSDVQSRMTGNLQGTITSFLREYKLSCQRSLFRDPQHCADEEVGRLPSCVLSLQGTTDLSANKGDMNERWADTRGSRDDCLHPDGALLRLSRARRRSAGRKERKRVQALRRCRCLFWFERNRSTAPPLSLEASGRPHPATLPVLRLGNRKIANDPVRLGHGFLQPTMKRHSCSKGVGWSTLHGAG
jgi:hypothetical protein